MGLTDKIEDFIVKKVSKKETVRLSYGQMVEIVKKIFINGADYEYMQKVLKTAKGGGPFCTRKTLQSKSGRYIFRVEGWNRGALLLGRRKMTYVYDNQENKFFQLDNDKNWKKFYKAVEAEIKSRS